MEPLNTYNKPCYETAYLGPNAKKILKQKVAKNVTILLGCFVFFK